MHLGLDNDACFYSTYDCAPGFCDYAGNGFWRADNPSMQDGQYAINPMSGVWIKTEIEIKYTTDNTGFIRVYENGVLKLHFLGYTDQMPGTIRAEAIEGYSSVTQDRTGNWRYMNDIYLDYTLQRVEICKGGAWDSRGLCEVQIPQNQWTDGLLQIKVNEGALTGSNYLYIVDSSGTPSDQDPNASGAQGYPITFGGGGGDTTAPSAPSGLSVQ